MFLYLGQLLVYLYTNIHKNIHKIEQNLSGNCSINLTGCDIISKSEMHMIFDKLSSTCIRSSRQIQKIVCFSLYDFFSH